ncbi:MAG: TolC family protein [Deltaproteobacteria bacterium]
MDTLGLSFRGRGRRWAPLVFSCIAGLTGQAAAETLSADQAVSRAATSNPTLRAALLDAAAARHAVVAERGARVPNLVASVQAEHSESASRAGELGPDSAGASSRTITDALSSKAALSYTTDLGTQLELGTATGVSWDKRLWSGQSPLPDNLNLGPSYAVEAYLSARQPLLRGAGTDAELAPLRQARAAARAAQSRQQQAASQTALDVLEAYWTLWYAERAVAVQEQAQSVAARLVSDAKLRANTLGTGAQIDVLQFSTSAASIADALSRARAERSTRAIELGRVLGLPPEATQSLAAAGEPPRPADDATLGALTEGAAGSSPELAALRSDLERARERVTLARDADQPRVDLFARASAGTLWDDSAGFSFGGGRPTYGVLGGVEIELPLGAGRSSGDAAAAQSELEAGEARYQAQLLALRARASSLSVNLKAAAEQVSLSTETATAATELADAERQRLLLGTTTAQNVVTAEQTSREAELRRLQALVNQASARFELEHSAGKLLERFAAL